MEVELTREQFIQMYNKTHYHLNKEYHQEKNRRHYQENKQKIIARSLARKQHIREINNLPPPKKRYSRLADDYIPTWLRPQTNQ